LKRRYPAILLLFIFLLGCASYQRDIYAKPKRREESLFVNWFKNTFIYQVQQTFDIERDIRVLIGCPKEAEDLDEQGNPPDSPLFTNRDISAMSPEEIARGANRDPPPSNPIKIIKLKKSGSAGFLGSDATGRLFLFKFDPEDFPELVTGAEIVGSRIIYALGYNVPQYWIVTVEGTGNPRFDGRRACATLIIEGELRGFIRSSSFRHRREMRALRLAYAFINNTDAKETNSLAVWRDGKPIYYFLDFGSSLGSDTTGPKLPKQGWENRWDAEVAIADILTLGLASLRKPYDPKAKPFSRAVGLFDGRLDPLRWKPNYPNIAFEDMTEADARWMARRIASFTEEQIRAAVRAARYSRKEDEDYIVRVLITRRNIIAAALDVPVAD